MKLYKKLSLLLSMGIMGIGLITFRFAPAGTEASDSIVRTEPGSTDKSDADATPTSAVTPTPTPLPTVAPTPTPVPNNLTEVTSDSEIYKLISSYLRAKLTCDRASFEGIVTNPELIDEDSLQAHYSTITGFDRIKCYTKLGTGNIDYIVYYTYYMDITTVNSQGISIDRSFITKAPDGSYRIFTGDVDDETQAYLDEVNNHEDVASLIDSVYTEMEKEIAEDETLLAYWIRMYNITGDAEPEDDISDSSEESEEASEANDEASEDIPAEG